MTQRTRAPAPSLATRGAKSPTPKREPVQYRYQLAQYIVERRDDGWYFAKCWSTVAGEKPGWQGPYDWPQDLCIAIARLLCAELSNRHQARAAFHNVAPGDQLYGLPPPPDLSPPRKRGGRS